MAVKSVFDGTGVLVADTLSKVEHHLTRDLDRSESFGIPADAGVIATEVVVHETQA